MRAKVVDTTFFSGYVSLEFFRAIVHLNIEGLFLRPKKEFFN